MRLWPWSYVYLYDQKPKQISKSECSVPDCGKKHYDSSRLQSGGIESDDTTGKHQRPLRRYTKFRISPPYKSFTSSLYGDVQVYKGLWLTRNPKNDVVEITTHQNKCLHKMPDCNLFTSQMLQGEFSQQPSLLGILPQQRQSSSWKYKSWKNPV